MESHFARMLAPEAAATSKVAAAKKKTLMAPAGSAYFIPSKTFQGAKPGYKFQRGKKGVGYYLDGVPPPEDTPEVKSDKKAKKRKLDEPEVSIHELEDLDEAAIAKLLEEADQKDIAPLDANGLRQMLLALEKKINRNQRLRMKFPDDPSKFMESEVDLDEELKSLQALSAAPELYPILVSLDAITSLLGLLTHENTDISISTIALLAELTDVEVLNESEEAICLVDALVENQGLELLMQNLSRLDESSEEDASGVYNTMQILENLTDVQPSICTSVCERTNILRFLLRRVKVRRFDGNKLYASELLSILLQSDPENQKRLGSIQGVDGIDTLLQGISYYKRKNPSSKDEEECIENLFDCLCTALLIPANQAKFRHSEGFELMLRCVKEGRFAAPAALRTLNFAMQNSPQNAERFVEAGGLKLVFPVFMGRGYPHKTKGRQKPMKRSREERQTSEQDAINIITSLCTQVTEKSSGDAQVRLLGKFVEKDFEKIDRLCELYFKYQVRVQEHDQNAMTTRHPDSDSEDEDDVRQAKRVLRRLDAGLLSLQQLAVTLSYVCFHAGECLQRAEQKMRQKGRSLSELRAVIKSYAEDLGAKYEDINEEIEEQRIRILEWVENL